MQSILTIFTDVRYVCARNEHVDDVSLHTHIHRYGDFLVNTISVGFTPIILPTVTIN